jgi:hypothetical protein
MNPIICIGNYHVDKKIRELMKVCVSFELKTPTLEQVGVILKSTLRSCDPTLHKNVARFIQGDLRKIATIGSIFNNANNGTASDSYNNSLIQTIFQPKTNNEDSKTIVKKLMNAPCKLTEHLALMNETDRTSGGPGRRHENVVDLLAKQAAHGGLPIRTRKRWTTSAWPTSIDRITFQKQDLAVQQNRARSSKPSTTIVSYHERFDARPKFNPSEVRFTKALTRCSTGYNNSLFIQMMRAENSGWIKKICLHFS